MENLDYIILSADKAYTIIFNKCDELCIDCDERFDIEHPDKTYLNQCEDCHKFVCDECFVKIIEMHNNKFLCCTSCMEKRTIN